jgi:hypothetical protein
MSINDPYITNITDIHLRDARHAHQLFGEYSHAFAPKTKFLYHVVFQPSSALGDATLKNTIKFQKEIGVLAKSLDLPSYRASIDVKQQYNRKKNIQTRLDYQDINIRLHDDNVGATRSMLEEYYKWYYADGRDDNIHAAYDPRDKFYDNVPTYGLNPMHVTGTHKPFFEFIKIYQLAKQNWASYTLVNPLLSAWQHGDLDYGDGAGLMENSITVAYESVLYGSGDINTSIPTGFTSQETLYDNVDSPHRYADNSIGKSNFLTPKLLDLTSNVPKGLIANASNSASTKFSTPVTTNGSRGALEQIVIPNSPGSSPNTTTTTTTTTTSSQFSSTEAIKAGLSTDPSALNSYVAKSLNTGAIPGTTLAAYNALDEAGKIELKQTLINKVKTGGKPAMFAAQALNQSKAAKANLGSLV